MATRKVPYNRQGINKLPNDKPVLYRIETDGGKLNYAGIAQRGRVPDRIGEHFGKIPGAKVTIEQFGSVNDARQKEQRVIARSKPRYNKQDK